MELGETETADCSLFPSEVFGWGSWRCSDQPCLTWWTYVHNGDKSSSPPPTSNFSAPTSPCRCMHPISEAH